MTTARLTVCHQVFQDQEMTGDDHRTSNSSSCKKKMSSMMATKAELTQTKGWRRWFIFWIYFKWNLRFSEIALDWWNLMLSCNSVAEIVWLSRSALNRLNLFESSHACPRSNLYSYRLSTQANVYNSSRMLVPPFAFFARQCVNYYYFGPPLSPSLSLSP